MSNERIAEIEAQLKSLQLVPVISLPSVDAGVRLAEILIRCGLPVVEVTFRTPCAADAIAAMKKEFDEILILAGTVLNTVQADIARDAGAECIVVPGFHRELVGYCQSQKMMVCPGTATPTEVLQCLDMGVKAVKFFPAEVAGGVAMLKAMAAVFSDVRFMPTGGISPANLADYLALDAVFCCGGSWLAPENMMAKGEWADIENRISEAVKVLSCWQASKG
jgi:2-dehydro-3-deoxyphosphogluconate aldolase/(4S)-4-hydroxy-2-oxoglutarate aldolase